MVLLRFAAAGLPAAGANIAAGSITLRLVPGGATATLDGVYQGLTPLGIDGLRIENIDPGPPTSSSAPGAAIATNSPRSESDRTSGPRSAPRSRRP